MRRTYERLRGTRWTGRAGVVAAAVAAAAFFPAVRLIVSVTAAVFS